MKSICIFCGSSDGAQPIYRERALAMGTAIAQSGLTLIYGGASVGLMGAVADAALAAGGRAVGVLPQSLKDKELAHPNLSELHIVASMHERKAKMAELSDGFVALPGGAGTLEEFFEVWTWAQLGYHGKPCALLNVNGYYDGVVQFMQHAVDERFVKREHVEMIMVDTDPALLLRRCADYKSVVVPKWIKTNL